MSEVNEIDAIQIAERLEEIATLLRSHSLKPGEARDNRTTLPERLRLERTSRKITQHDLAETAGVSPNTVINIEGGKSVPRRQTLVALAEALGVSVERLDG